MERGLVILSLSLLVIPTVLGAMDPVRGFCEHQDYTVDLGFYENDSAYYFCVFDDENKCDMNEFYRGNCGQEFKKEFQCREEGKIVFSQFEECCKGLKPYLPPDIIGQSSCQPFSKRFVGNLKYISLYWAVGIAILILIVFIIVRVIRKKK